MTTRILSVDFGHKRVGLAVTDPLGLTIQPLPYHPFTGKKNFLSALKNLIEEKGVQKIVLGLPKSLDGSLGPRALECQRLAKDLEEFCGVPVDLQDESFSSREAESFLIEELGLSRKKRKEVRDSMAACLILKNYLSYS